jgi:hypothetical protein
MKSSTLVFLFGVFGLLFFDACVGVNYPDPIDPRLPKFTDSGNDAAGALINDMPWVAVRNTSFVSQTTGILDIDRTYDDPSLVLTVDNGWWKKSTSDSTRVTIRFVLHSFLPNTEMDLNDMDGRTFVLDGTTDYGEIVFEDLGQISSQGVGQLIVHKAEVKMEDGILKHHIVATFAFDTPLPAAVNYGRLDYGYVWITGF